MKISKSRILLLIAFIIGNSYSVKCQVYISDYFGGDIFVGPNNVMFVNDKIKEHFVADLKYEIDIIKSELFLIDSLENMQNISRRDKKKLKKLKTENSQLENEVVFLKNLLLQWQNFEPLELDVEQEYCRIGVENQINKKVEISQTEMKSYNICEFVEFEFVPPSTKWVKKKADYDCLSKNPDDCFVLCLVGDVGNPDYFSFEFNNDDSIFYRFIEIEFNDPEEIYTILETGTKNLVPHSEIILCDEK